MPLLVISEILGLFINTLTADVQYFLPNTEYLLEPIKIQLSKEKSFFLNFLLYFWNLHQILNSLKKEGEQHSLCISEIVECERPDYLNVWKDPIQNTLQTVDMLNGLEHWWNLKDSVSSYFSSLWEKLSWNTFLLVISEITGLFVGTLTADDEFSLDKRENLYRTN